MLRRLPRSVGQMGDPRKLLLIVINHSEGSTGGIYVFGKIGIIVTLLQDAGRKVSRVSPN